MRICLFNVENLFILLDLYNNQEIDTLTEDEWQSFNYSLTCKNKSLDKVIKIKNILKEIDADVYMFCEVGGVESLENFNKLFLDKKYKTHIRQGNDARGICVGYLTKKNIPWRFQLKTNKTLATKKGKIGRDVLELRVRSRKSGKMKFIFMLVHLKSKRSSVRDFMGLSKRQAEVEAVMGHYKFRKETFGVPVILAGDMNGTADKENHEPEFDKIYETDLLDVHDIVKSTQEERSSFVGFYPTRAVLQLDYIFLPKEFHNNIEKVYNYRYKNDYGDVLELPQTFKEKRENASDHFPVVLDLKTSS